jgi:hypothetical protein
LAALRQTPAKVHTVTSGLLCSHATWFHI